MACDNNVRWTALENTIDDDDNQAIKPWTIQIKQSNDQSKQRINRPKIKWSTKSSNQSIGNHSFAFCYTLAFKKSTHRVVEIFCFFNSQFLVGCRSTVFCSNSRTHIIPTRKVSQLEIQGKAKMPTWCATLLDAIRCARVFFQAKWDITCEIIQSANGALVVTDFYYNFARHNVLKKLHNCNNVMCIFWEEKKTE